MHRGLSAIPIVFVLLLGPLGAPASAAHSSPCDVVASATGSDSAPGTLGLPLATPQQLTEQLQPGQTGCLRGGIYLGQPLSGDPTGQREVRLDAPGSVLRSYPHERATIIGRIYISATADGSVLEGLNLDGQNAKGSPSPSIDASNVTVRNNDIYNGHTAICFGLGQPGFGEAVNVKILDNRIHGCGKLPAANHDHGIYVVWGEGTLIRGNLIYDNADRGIQLYPDAHESLVVGNVIAGNGQGIVFGGDEVSASTGNIARYNVISDSVTRFNIESSWGGTTGAGNYAVSNCVWSAQGGYLSGAPSGSGILDQQIGFQAFDNRVANPGFGDIASGDLRVRNRRCAKLLATGRSKRVIAKLKRGKAIAVGMAPSAHSVFLKGSGRSAPVGLDGSFRIKLRGGKTVRIGAPGMKPSRALNPGG
jgi:hypothetical protein